MHKKIKKIISYIGYVLFFGGYSYIVFVNLACSFLMSADSRGCAILFLATAAVAIVLPGIICWRHHYIKELEGMIGIVK